MRIKYLGVFIILVLFLITIYHFFYNNTSYNINYIESVNSKTKFSPKLNSLNDYKNYCKKDKDHSLCKMIDTNYFLNYFSWECEAVQKLDQKYCDSLIVKENIEYCKNNLMVYDIILNGNRDDCYKLWKTIYWKNWNEIWHANKENIDFCVWAYDLKGTKDINKIKDFTIKSFWEPRFLPRVLWIIKQDSKYCYESSWIDDKIKCLIYTKSLNCSMLKDKDYIYELINNTNHFYDN